MNPPSLKPFKSRTFFLDLSNTSRKLIRDLESFGAKEVLSIPSASFVVSDRAQVLLNKSNPSPSFSGPRSNSSILRDNSYLDNAYSPVANSPSFDKKNPRIQPYSRGMSMLKATEQSQKQHRKGDIVELCRKYKVKIYSIQQMSQIIKKYKMEQSIRNISEAMEKKSVDVTKLLAPFIKIEDVDRKYRPKYKSLSATKLTDLPLFKIMDKVVRDNKASGNMNNNTRILQEISVKQLISKNEAHRAETLSTKLPENTISNFAHGLIEPVKKNAQVVQQERNMPSISKKNQRYVKETSSALKAPGNSIISTSKPSNNLFVPPVAIKEERENQSPGNKAKKEIQKSKEQKRYYCEVCNIHYRDESHFETRVHDLYLKNPKNYACVQEIISRLPTMDDFLADVAYEDEFEEELTNENSMEVDADENTGYSPKAVDDAATDFKTEVYHLDENEHISASYSTSTISLPFLGEDVLSNAPKILEYGSVDLKQQTQVNKTMEDNLDAFSSRVVLNNFAEPTQYIPFMPGSNSTAYPFPDYHLTSLPNRENNYDFQTNRNCEVNASGCNMHPFLNEGCQSGWQPVFQANEMSLLPLDLSYKVKNENHETNCLDVFGNFVNDSKCSVNVERDYDNGARKIRHFSSKHQDDSEIHYTVTCDEQSNNTVVDEMAFSTENGSRVKGDHDVIIVDSHIVIEKQEDKYNCFSDSNSDDSLKEKVENCITSIDKDAVYFDSKVYVLDEKLASEASVVDPCKQDEATKSSNMDKLVECPATLISPPAKRIRLQSEYSYSHNRTDIKSGEPSVAGDKFAQSAAYEIEDLNAQPYVEKASKFSILEPSILTDKSSDVPSSDIYIVLDKCGESESSYIELDKADFEGWKYYTGFLTKASDTANRDFDENSVHDEMIVGTDISKDLVEECKVDVKNIRDMKEDHSETLESCSNSANNAVKVGERMDYSNTEFDNAVKELEITSQSVQHMDQFNNYGVSQAVNHKNCSDNMEFLGSDINKRVYDNESTSKSESAISDHDFENYDGNVDCLETDIHKSTYGTDINTYKTESVVSAIVKNRNDNVISFEDVHWSNSSVSTVENIALNKNISDLEIDVCKTQFVSSAILENRDHVGSSMDWSGNSVSTVENIYLNKNICDAEINVSKLESVSSSITENGDDAGSSDVDCSSIKVEETLKSTKEETSVSDSHGVLQPCHMLRKGITQTRKRKLNAHEIESEVVNEAMKTSEKIIEHDLSKTLDSSDMTNSGKIYESDLSQMQSKSSANSDQTDSLLNDSLNFGSQINESTCSNSSGSTNSNKLEMNNLSNVFSNEYDYANLELEHKPAHIVYINSPRPLNDACA